MILSIKRCKTSNPALSTSMKHKRNRVFSWTLSQVSMLACFLFVFSVLFSSASANELVAAPSPSSSSSTLDKRPLPSPEVKAPPPSPSNTKKPAKAKPKPTTGPPIPPTTPSITAEDCSRARKKYVSLNFPLDSVAGSPIPGTALTTCSATYTCCTPKMERRLLDGVGQNVRQNVRTVLRKPAMQLETREAQLLKFLHKVLNASYSQLNNMFTRTYGLHYNQNAQLFVDFYSRMHKYLNGQEDNVTKIVDSLFTNMGMKMIKMLHMKDRMGNNYPFRYPITNTVRCLVKNFHGAQAYGSGPETLKKNLIRSLTAGRTLAMVLAVQREVLATVMKKLMLEPECLNALTRVNYCSLCSGLTDSQPCSNFCHNVIRGCFAQIYQFSDRWVQLSNKAQKLTTMLEGRDNLVYIFESTIAVKLSESITNFQTNFQQNKEKIYTKCRSPYRFKRRAMPRKGVSLASPKARKLWRTRRSANFGTLRAEFKRLLTNLKMQVLIPQTNLWTTATDGLCRDGPFYSSADPNRCWNGTAIGPYEGVLVANTLKGQVENPEVAVDMSRSKSDMSHLAWLLREAHQRVASANIQREVSHLVFSRTDLGRPLTPSPPQRPIDTGRVKTGFQSPGVEGSGTGPGLKPNPGAGWSDRASGSGDSVLPSRPDPRRVVATTKPPRTPIDDDDADEASKAKLPFKIVSVDKPQPAAEGSGGGSGDGAVLPARPKPRPKPETRPSANPWAPKKEMQQPSHWIGRKRPETPPKKTKPQSRPKQRQPVTNNRNRWSQRLPTPGDDEDSVEGSGSRPQSFNNWGNSKTVEGSGSSLPTSGDGPLPENQRNIGYDGRQTNILDKARESYPTEVWLPKKVRVETVDRSRFGDYTVQTESQTGRQRNCQGPNCNASRSLAHNFLLLLTTAMLAALLFV